MTTDTHVRFEGKVRDAYQLVEELQAAGLSVEWVPPPEERVSAVETIVIIIVARGAYDILVAVLDRARKRLAGDATISEEESQGPPA